MSRSKLSDAQWEALWAAEMAGRPRRELAIGFGVAVSTIASRARKEGRLKRDSGAWDHRCRPPEGWPPERRLPQNRAGMTLRRWIELLTRYQAGEADTALAAEYGVSRGTVHARARALGMRKKDNPDAVWRRRGPPTTAMERLDDGTWRISRGEEGFILDPAEPQRAIDDVLARAARFARVDNIREVSVRLGLIQKLKNVFGGGDGETADPDDDAPAAPIALRPAQRPPEGDWSTWLFLGGRGAGKTLAGASWLADQAEALGRGGRLALIGPTLHDVREVMIEGVSGIRSLPRWTRATRPKFQASRRRLVFANGCLAYAFSAEDPDSLRGPQFSAAWADEFCAWRGSGPRGAAETLALLRMGLRLPLAPRVEGQGSGVEADRASDPAPATEPSSPSTLDPRPSTLSVHPRLVVTTTPRPTRALVRLRDEASCVLTHAPTADNADHLSPGFLDGLHALYGGTRRAAQELEGKIVELDGALFTAEMMQKARAWPVDALPSPLEGEGGPEGRMRGLPASRSSSDSQPADTAPSSERLRRPPSPSRGEGIVGVPSTLDPRPSTPCDRVVVAIDPTTTAAGNACGLIAAASCRRPDGVRCAVVLADRSIAGLGPDAWARRAVALAEEVHASAIVAEVNQGGDMVKAVLKTAGTKLKIREVRATRGKYVRAEPVAALYEQGRIRHAGAFDALEEELMAFGGEMEAAGSLDRADALVWAITDLLIDAPDGERGPRVRWL